MATEENVTKMFETVCAAITEAGLHYEQNDAKRVIEFSLAANPFPVQYRIAVRAASSRSCRSAFRRTGRSGSQRGL